MKLYVAIAAFILAGACAHHAPASTPAAASAVAPEFVTVEGAYGFDETVQRLDSAIAARGLKATKFDHAANASSVGLSLRPTTLFTFGNPKGGTPLMGLAPSVGIDLPMKTLVYTEGGKTFLVYTNVDRFAARHGLPVDAAPLGAMRGLLQAVTAEAAGR